MPSTAASPRLETLLFKLGMRAAILGRRLTRDLQKDVLVADSEEAETRHEEATRAREAFTEALDWAAIRSGEERDDIQMALSSPQGEYRDTKTIRVLLGMTRLDNAGETQGLYDALLEEYPDSLQLAESREVVSPSEEKRKGVSYQTAGGYLDDCRIKGEPFTSYEDFAGRIGCSVSTVKKAVDRGTVELQEWAKKQVGQSRLNLSQKATAIALKEVSQNREPLPGSTLEPLDVEWMLRHMIEQAKPEERARINAMDSAQKRALAEAAYNDPDTADQALRYSTAGSPRNN